MFDAEYIWNIVQKNIQNMVPKIWNIVQEKYEIGCRKGMKYGAKIYETLAGKILNVVKKNIK